MQSSHKGWNMRSPERLESTKAGVVQSEIVHERDATQQRLECAVRQTHQASNKG